MKGLQIPALRTKVSGVERKFDLTDPKEREEYFQAKAGKEIEIVKDYLAKGGTFVGYMLGKKGSGKGTRAKMLAKLVGEDRIAHVSVGDVVRDAHAVIDGGKGSELRKYLEKNYRGPISLDEAIDVLLGRSASKLLPTELILALVKWEVEKHKGKALFIDGFPRSMDQVATSLYFRELIEYREDPDFFVIVDLPEEVIDERIKTRVVCPECQVPRSPKLMVTSKVGHDTESGEFYLQCDNPECNEARMVPKEGDELGIEAIRDRLEGDGELIKKAFVLHGIPKIVLRNDVPVEEAKDLVDDYEITPEYVFSDDGKDGVVVGEKPWEVKSDEGERVYSLLAEPHVVALVKQLAEILS